MRGFADGETDVLVATSVIEVGIDVPNATVMLIEAAERYGLSQLHQLRGRVGRGEHESVCILFGDPKLPRLEAIASDKDGFALAEVDLDLRGAGEVLGTRQSGMPEFRVARLPEDQELLERARAHADATIAADPDARAARARAAARRGDRPLRLRPGPDPGVRVIAGTHRGRRLSRPGRRPPDARPRPRGAVLDARRRDRRGRARPVRRLGRAGDRGAVARRRERGVRGRRTRGHARRSGPT